MGHANSHQILHFVSRRDMADGKGAIAVLKQPERLRLAIKTNEKSAIIVKR